MFCEGIKWILELEDFFEVVVEVENGKNIVVKVCEYKLDIVLMDINMLIVNGLDVIEMLVC